MTFPNVVRDLLMFAPSCNNKGKIIIQSAIEGILVNSCDDDDDDILTFSLVPLAPVESARSLPAKSTRLILLT